MESLAVRRMLLSEQGRLARQTFGRANISYKDLPNLSRDVTTLKLCPYCRARSRFRRNGFVEYGERVVLRKECINTIGLGP